VVVLGTAKLGTTVVYGTNVSLYLLLLTVLIISIFRGSLYNAKLVPTRSQLIVEEYFKFVRSIVKEQAANEGLKFLPLFFTTFTFILFSNFLGLLPLSATITAHLSITAFLALSFNLFFFFYGLSLHGLKFFNLFLPKGSPLILLPIIFIIEIISYSLRTISLSVRLFANMMAGHTLLHILASFIFVSSSLWIIPFILVIAVTLLEIGIAFLQAYVFLVLLCIYFNEAVHPVH